MRGLIETRCISERDNSFVQVVQYGMRNHRTRVWSKTVRRTAALLLAALLMSFTDVRALAAEWLWRISSGVKVQR